MTLCEKKGEHDAGENRMANRIAHQRHPAEDEEYTGQGASHRHYNSNKLGFKLMDCHRIPTPLHFQIPFTLRIFQQSVSGQLDALFIPPMPHPMPHQSSVRSQREGKSDENRCTQHDCRPGWDA